MGFPRQRGFTETGGRAGVRLVPLSPLQTLAMSPRFQSLFAVALATTLAACAPDTPSDPPDAVASAAGGAAADGHRHILVDADAVDPTQAMQPLPKLRSAAALAGYPDRGDLVGYDRVRQVQRQGAHTFHPVQVSEAHALAAIGTGTLHLTAPDGGQVELAYERSVEHANGDWSWIGRDAHGIDGILTFGEKAVFGVMPYGNDTLRLTTYAGQAWMATTTRGVQSPLDQRIRAGVVGADYKIPPRDPSSAHVDGMAAATSPMAGAPVAMAAAPSVTPAATTTVDVLLGYTPGFASMMGGTSQAQTRLNHLVTVGNQTFTNSNVDVQLRLVGTLQVSYTDTGSNDNALEQLTGSDGTSNNIPVPASLQPLHDARETLGADLVSLVRRFRDADQEGCGIAWLIGGGQAPIVAGHERFGYSVISDSNGMLAPDNGHFCRDETLVHELGHNFGSQHDEAAARGTDGTLDLGDYGRYPYSFGLKTNASNGNFYTVMAYGDEGQTGYRIFSNPQSTFCGGRACGIANQADNARSLRQTAPLIAAFRASAALGQVRSDFNGDGRSDLFWRKSNNGRNAIWLSGDNTTQQAITGVAGGWQPIGAGDFDGDGRVDIAWRHPSSGRNVIWRSGNANTTIAMTGIGNPAWSAVGVGDFNGDGRSDVLWRDGVTGRNAIWLSGNAGTQQAISTLPNANWRVAGVGDMDGDGRDDIVWRHASTGQNSVWRSGNSSTSTQLSTVALSWAILAVDDFDGDGRADIFWRQASSGRNALWRSGNSATQITVPGVGGAWTVVDSGDYDGDGVADLVWRNMSSGRNTIWRRANASNTLSIATVSDMTWQVVP